MKYLLGNRNSLSARILATKLGLKFTSVHYQLLTAPTIRYGNSSGVFDNDTSYNSPQAIRNCGNSEIFSKLCKDNSINSPLYTRFDINLLGDYEFPFLLRNSHHIAGKDIIIVENKEQLDGLIETSSLDGKYHVPYFDTDLELGIHFVNGEVIKIFKKVPGTNVTSERIRSSVMGWRYYLISDFSQFTIAQNLALNTAKIMEINFGRADIGYNSKNKKYVIFEINTAPGMANNNNTAELYATKLREVIDV